MISNVARFLIVLSVCCIVASNPDRAIDCRKFVFAPLCRGVAAKRGNVESNGVEPSIYIDDKSFQEFLRSLYNGMNGAEDEDDLRVKPISKEEEAENQIRNYQQKRDNRFFRLLLKSKRINSDTDNVPVHEYENL